MATVVGALDALVNGVTTTLARLSLLRRLLQRLRKWWQTLRQISVLALWLLPMAVAFGKQARQSQPLLQLQQAGKGLGTLLRSLRLRLRLARMQTSLSAALLQLAQQAARLRRQARCLTAGRLSQPLLRLQQAAVKSALALQRSVLKAQSRLLAKLNGKPNRVPQPAGQMNPAQARTTQNSPAPAHHGNGQREE
jgi:hypothetical protein